MVFPVIQALRETPAYLQGDITIEVLGLPAAKHSLRTYGVDSFGFDDYLDPNGDADALAWGMELAKTHHSPTIGIELKDSVAYLGLSYKDLVLRLGRDEAARLFAEKGRNAFYPVTVMERIFDRVRPDFVVTTNSPRAEAAAIDVANMRGIDNLSITDGFTGTGGYRLRARNITFINEFAHRRFAADGRLGDQECNYYYTGNPAFDKLQNIPREKEASWIQAHFPDARGRPIVLHADMPAYWHTKKDYLHIKSEAEIIEEVAVCYDAVISNGGVYLIRPHPSQKRTLAQEWVRGRKDAYLAADYDLHQLLRNVDLLLARSTVVGLEAGYMRKRILQLDCDIHTDSPLVEFGIAWGSKGYATLPEEMREALNDDLAFDAMMKRTPHVLPDGLASEKIAYIILEKLRVAGETTAAAGYANT
jgi:hypothetical protein